MSDKKENPKTEEIDQIMAELDQLQKQVPDNSAAIDPEIKEQIEEVIEAHEKEKQVTNDPEDTALIEEKSDSTLDEIRAEASQDSEDSVSLDDSFGDMKQEDIQAETSSFGDSEEELNNVTPLHHSHSNNTGDSLGNNGSLQMTLSGNIQLELKYAQGGDEVSIHFQDGYFCVSLNNGAEFKIPLHSSEGKLKNSA